MADKKMPRDKAGRFTSLENAVNLTQADIKRRLEAAIKEAREKLSKKNIPKMTGAQVASKFEKAAAAATKRRDAWIKKHSGK